MSETFQREILSKKNIMKNESEAGFPLGRVAETIRKTISPSFSSHDVESIAVVLVSHLMIEERINTLIVKWLTKNLPNMRSKNKKGVSVNDIARNEIIAYVEKMDFTKKIKLIKPLGTLLWGDDSKDIFDDLYKINTARVEIAHRLDIRNARIENLSLSTEEGVEMFLDLSQQRLLNVSDLIALISG